MNSKSSHFSLLKFNELDSTNNYAHQLIKSGKISMDTIVIADFQTHGKGHDQNIWVSDKNSNLTFSLILQPEFLPIQHQFMLSKMISIAIRDFIATILPKQTVKIKWPNDILVNEKKIAGILIEHMISGNKISESIIGIGININQKEFPPFTPPATSLSNQKTIDFDLDWVLDQLISLINKWYRLLKNEGFITLNQEYLSHLFRINEKAAFSIDDKIESAIIRGIDEFGRLEVENKFGEINSFDLKDIVFLY